MNASPIDRSTFHSRGRQQGVTYKIWICGWISRHEGRRGPVHRVCWTVAGHRRVRLFHSLSAARELRDQLQAAVMTGQPFDIRSGLPLALAPQGCAGHPVHRSRQRRKDGGAHD
ncbi:hypothetical protein Sme01_38320 [Sphaerisporangium melleum]|uniref:Uncharacterized protein n=1 Tax=Sphaerisporangium melleum TaxID=321316 RepID=A0A917VIL1_9ACTN|nr:hypothetical protein GCM10007964_26170 [Sphaerisporangium melleum]GII71356.1 hypothetical protein Sme01_38320 [Sphaerisporangium melleum]